MKRILILMVLALATEEMIEEHEPMIVVDEKQECIRACEEKAAYEAVPEPEPELEPEPAQ